MDQKQSKLTKEEVQDLSIFEEDGQGDGDLYQMLWGISEILSDRNVPGYGPCQCSSCLGMKQAEDKAFLKAGVRQEDRWKYYIHWKNGKPTPRLMTPEEQAERQNCIVGEDIPKYDFTDWSTDDLLELKSRVEQERDFRNGYFKGFRN